ncbi:MAG: esterase family protein [Actinomycetota bacterium]|nr:esterase family protein [Actinomycetota bacterium]
MGRLSVISPGFLAVIVAVSVLLWLSFVRLRRHRRVLAVTVAALATTMSLATTADAVNVHFQYLPRVGDVLGQGAWPTAGSSGLLTAPAEAPVATGVSGATVKTALAPAAPVAIPVRPRGAVVPIDILNARGLGAPDGLAYLPPQYFTEPARRFPVVYLLHGSPGVPLDWLRGGDAVGAGAAAANDGHPTIIVLPHVSQWWLDDSECVDGAREQVETYLFSAVLPSVDAQLRTVATRDARGIAGMSAGGYCALNLGLRHRDQISTILDMSGLVRPTHAGGMTALFGRRADLDRVVAANTPEIYAKTLPAAPDMHVWLDSGSGDDEVLPGLTAMNATLRARGIDSGLHLRPGAHTFAVWRPGLRDSLGWASARMSPGQSGQSSRVPQPAVSRTTGSAEPRGATRR